MRHKDWQAQTRTGVPAADVAEALRQAWDTSPDGRAFAVALRQQGLTLARGRRGIVAVDAAGTPHSLARRLGLKAEAVRRKLADLDPARLPTVEDAKSNPSPIRSIDMTNRKPPRPLAAASQAPRKPSRQSASDTAPDATPPNPAYWTGLGLAVEEIAGMLLVTLPSGTRLEDRGD